MSTAAMMMSGSAAGGGGAGYFDLTRFIAYYKMEEATSATRLDSTIQAYSLTSNNGVTQVTGKLSNAAGFASASSQFLSHTDNADFSLNSTSFSIVAWVYLTDRSADYTLCGKYNFSTTNREFNLYLTATSGNIAFQTSPDGTNANSHTFSGGVSAATTWTHIALTYNSATNDMFAYVNGTATDTAFTFSTGIFNGASDFMVGARHATISGQWFNGRIDGFGLARSVFSPADIVTLYNGGTGLDPS